MDVCPLASPFGQRRTSLQTQWFETFFQGPAVEFWNRVVPQQLTNTECDWLEKNLALKSGAQVLDVPCGSGRHAVGLARRGYSLTGIDLSDDFLTHARKHPGIEWRKADMRSLDLAPDSFAAAYCFGNSFGYLNRDEAAAFASSVANALRAGGRFAIDAPTAAEYMLSVIRDRWHQAGDLYVLSRPTYVPETSRIDIEYTFIEGDKVDKRHSASYLFTCAELIRMLREAGFSEVQLHGDLQGNPFRLGSERLWILAIK